MHVEFGALERHSGAQYRSNKIWPSHESAVQRSRAKRSVSVAVMMMVGRPDVMVVVVPRPHMVMVVMMPWPHMVMVVVPRPMMVMMVVMLHFDRA